MFPSSQLSEIAVKVVVPELECQDDASTCERATCDECYAAVQAGKEGHD